MVGSDCAFMPVEPTLNSLPPPSQPTPPPQPSVSRSQSIRVLTMSYNSSSWKNEKSCCVCHSPFSQVKILFMQVSLNSQCRLCTHAVCPKCCSTRLLAGFDEAVCVCDGCFQAKFGDVERISREKCERECEELNRRAQAMLKEIDDITQERNAVNSELIKAQTQFTAAEDREIRLNSQIESQNSAICELKDTISRLQAELAQHPQCALASILPEISDLKDQNSQLLTQIQSLLHDRVATMQHTAMKIGEIPGLKGKIKELQKTTAELQRELSEKRLIESELNSKLQEKEGILSDLRLFVGRMADALDAGRPPPTIHPSESDIISKSAAYKDELSLLQRKLHDLERENLTLRQQLTDSVLIHSDFSSQKEQSDHKSATLPHQTVIFLDKLSERFQTDTLIRLTSENDSLRFGLESLRGEKILLIEELATTKAKLSQCESRIREANEANSAIAGQYSLANLTVSSLETSLARLQADNDAKQLKIEQLTEEITQIREELVTKSKETHKWLKAKHSELATRVSHSEADLCDFVRHRETSISIAPFEIEEKVGISVSQMSDLGDRQTESERYDMESSEFRQ